MIFLGAAHAIQKRNVVIVIMERYWLEMVMSFMEGVNVLNGFIELDGIQLIAFHLRAMKNYSQHGIQNCKY